MSLSGSELPTDSITFLSPWVTGPSFTQNLGEHVFERSFPAPRGHAIKSVWPARWWRDRMGFLWSLLKGGYLLSPHCHWTKVAGSARSHFGLQLTERWCGGADGEREKEHAGACAQDPPQLPRATTLQDFTQKGTPRVLPISKGILQKVLRGSPK